MIAIVVTCCSLAGEGGDDRHCCNTYCQLADKDADDTTMTILLSVSGLYFANPKSTYFSLGKIQKDQVGQRDVFVPMTWLLGWKIEDDG